MFRPVISGQSDVDAAGWGADGLRVRIAHQTDRVREGTRRVHHALRAHVPFLTGHLQNRNLKS